MAIACRLLVQGRQAVEDRNVLAVAQLHDRLLPRARLPARDPAPLGLGLDAERPDLDDVDVEQRLDRLADVRLVRIGVDAERVAVGGREHIGLLRDHRADDHLCVLHQALTSSALSSEALRSPARAASSLIAGSDTTSEDARRRSVTPTLSDSSAATRSGLRQGCAAEAPSAVRTSSVWWIWLVGPQPSRRPSA